MITSDKQYEAAKKQLALLTESLSSSAKKGVPNQIEQAGRVQTQELIDEIKESVNEYHVLRHSRPSTDCALRERRLSKY